MVYFRQNVSMLVRPIIAVYKHVLKKTKILVSLAFLELEEISNDTIFVFKCKN